MILKYTACKKSWTNIIPVYNGLNQLYFLEINNLKFMVYCKPEITGDVFPNNVSAG